MRLNPRSVALAFVFLLISTAAQAQLCSVSVDRGLAFGTYSPTAIAPRDTSATINVSCNATVGLLISYSIQLQSATGRTMVGPKGTLSYVLATDPVFSAQWPNGPISGSILLTVLNLFGNRQHPVYARLPAGQMAGPGSYTGSLMLTITY